MIVNFSRFWVDLHFEFDGSFGCQRPGAFCSIPNHFSKVEKVSLCKILRSSLMGRIGIMTERGSLANCITSIGVPAPMFDIPWVPALRQEFILFHSLPFPSPSPVDVS